MKVNIKGWISWIRLRLGFIIMFKCGHTRFGRWLCRKIMQRGNVKVEFKYYPEENKRN